MRLVTVVLCDHEDQDRGLISALRKEWRVSALDETSDGAVSGFIASETGVYRGPQQLYCVVPVGVGGVVSGSEVLDEVEIFEKIADYCLPITGYYTGLRGGVAFI